MQIIQTVIQMVWLLGLSLFRADYFLFFHKTQSDHVSSFDYFPIIAAGAN